MDSVGDYLSRIARYPLLTGEQEISLSKKILKAEKLIKGESQSFNREEKKTIQIGTKAKEKLGWEPKVDFEGLAKMMYDADLRALSK